MRGEQEEVGTLRIGSLEIRHFLKYSSIRMKEKFFFSVAVPSFYIDDLVPLVLSLILNILCHKKLLLLDFVALKSYFCITFLLSVISDLTYHGHY